MMKSLVYAIAAASIFVLVHVLCSEWLEISRDVSVFLSICVATLGPFLILYGWNLRPSEVQISDD